MSALPPKADMRGAARDVRFVPIADMTIKSLKYVICSSNKPAGTGMSKPLAVFKFITNSNLVDCTTGKSAGRVCS